MHHNQNHQKITLFLQDLRQIILDNFCKLDTNPNLTLKPWQYRHKGGGEIGLIKGEVFEKAAVNFSAIYGEKFPTDEAVGPFFATGISLITHMQNPHAPTVHMNLRFFETKNGYWFGGGYDLTPMGFPYEEDSFHFHRVAKDTLDSFDKTLYPKFYENAKEYFFIPHRQKERGIGGIFFDHYASGDFEKDFSLWSGLGSSFLETIMPIYHRRIHSVYGEKERLVQLQMRGHYVEFNLVYDRGTRFGFLSGGNPEAILCSMPPLASW